MVVFVVVIESWSYPESVNWKQLPNWSETGLKRVWNHRKRPFASPPPTYIERFWNGEPEGVSEWFQTGFRPFWGRSRGFALFPEKRLNLMLRQWNQNKKINTSFLQLKNEIKQWCCNRRSKDSEMVSRKVFPSGFRLVSDPFGGAHGLCPLSGNPQGELKNNTSLFALREVWQNRGCRSPSSSSSSSR